MQNALSQKATEIEWQFQWKTMILSELKYIVSFIITAFAVATAHWNTSQSWFTTFAIFTSLFYDMNMLRLNLCRSCRQRCSVRKGVLRNFTKFTGRHLRQSLYFNKDFIKIETLAQVFSCEFCKISKNIFFTEYVWATASTFDCYWTFFLLPSWLIHISFKYPSQFSGLRRVRSPTDSCQT